MLTWGFDNMPQDSVASLSWAHPHVQEWFAGRFSSATEPQEQGWPPILAGKSTLICAPTGSGKTLAAFLACIDHLIRKALGGGLKDRTEVLYVSPLKALSNDIRRNLEVPLSEITALAGQRGLVMPPIRAAVRTGDTMAPERRAMLAHPPHILVTTPESLYILLTAEKSRAILGDVETRISHHLARRLGADAVAAHHGSLSRKVRLVAENKLKSGDVRVLVATASLELGIDIGTVDLVCQIESPHSIAVALQRIGRAGHWRGAVPKGRLFAMTRDELIECAALIRALRQGELDRLEIPDSPLDILAQQIVAICACEEWNEDDLFQVVRRAYPYRDLARQDFDAVLEILSEGITARRGRYGAYLHRDRVRHRLRGRRGSRLVAITNGDVFLLGNTSWRITRIEGSSGRVLVEDAHGASPNIPFWLGEAPARTPELSARVSEVREKISDLADVPESRVAADVAPGFSPARADLKVGATSSSQKQAAISWMKEQCGLDDAGAEQAVEYILAGRAMLGAVPTQNRIVAERFFDEGGGMQLVIHAPFGSRINKAWGLALRKRFCRSFNFELQAAATEDGLNISLGEQHSFPLAEVFHFLAPESVAAVLEQAALVSPLFATRWRWDATRALALPRFRNGKKIPLQIQRMRADDLLAAVFPDAAACQENLEGDIHVPDHPLIREVMKDVLTQALDLEGLKRVLRGIRDGSIRCIAVDTPAPSPFSHEILNANPYAYLDDAPLEERRARAVSLRRVLPETVLSEIGRLDPAAIAQVREEAWPDVRDADELSEVLQVLVALPENFVTLGGPPVAQALLPVYGSHSGEVTTQARVPVPRVAASWGDLFRQLVAANRAARGLGGDDILWVAAERIKTFSILFPGARFETQPAEIGEPVFARDDALLQLVRGWMGHSGPVEIPWLACIVGLPAGEIEAAMLRLEGECRVLRGQFTGAAPIEWCDRRLLARIHRLTLGTLRKEIQPVTRAQFMRWLLRWQHIAPGTQVVAGRGVLEVIRQLQGFEAPANAWEPHLLAPRVAGYDPQLLDQLCLTGAVGWGRLSPHPATLEPGEASAAPLSRNLTKACHSERSEESRSALDSDRRSAVPVQSEIPRCARNDTPAIAARRVVPSSVAPITFFVREESDWMIPRHPPLTAASRALSHVAREVLEFIGQRGASFFTDIVRGTGKLKSEVETALWELVAASTICAPSSIPNGGPGKGEGAALARDTARDDGHCSFQVRRRIARRPSRRFAACCWSVTAWCFEN
jgi:ATP-dependent Lhr-like helicase